MKRKILSILLTVLISVSFVPSALAAEVPTVTYDGSKISYNYTDTNHFGSAFVDMLPGESRTLEINLVNTASEAANFFMDTEVIKAFEDSIKASGAAYTVSLDIVQDGNITNVYGGSKGSTIGGNDNGLYDLNGSLNDTFLAAKVESGKTAVVRLSVALDGESNNNNYQSLNGTFQFEFSVIKGEDYSPTVNPTPGHGTGVKTGDTAQTGFIVILLAASAVAITVVMIVGKRKKSGGAK